MTILFLHSIILSMNRPEFGLGLDLEPDQLSMAESDGFVLRSQHKIIKENQEPTVNSSPTREYDPEQKIGQGEVVLTERPTQVK